MSGLIYRHIDESHTVLKVGEGEHVSTEEKMVLYYHYGHNKWCVANLEDFLMDYDYVGISQPLTR